MKRRYRREVVVFFVVGTSLLLSTSIWLSMEITFRSHCTRINNVVFLKTHKTGSCTVQNIFLRYGVQNELIFALPNSTMMAGYPEPFKPHHVKPLSDPSLEYNIFCFHARFNYSAFQKIMPDSTKYITVLRNPVPMFESLYDYFCMQKGVHFTLEQLMRIPETNPILQRRWGGMLGINQMAFDLGLSNEHFRSPKLLLDFVLRIDRQFHLVMISELMDESLILLRHILCWDMDDIVAFSHNVRVNKVKSNLSKEVKRNISIINGADEFLYHYFRKKLERTIIEFGTRRMQHEVEQLQRQRRVYKDNCVGSVETKENILQPEFQPIRDGIMGFNLKSSEEVCKNLARAEVPFIYKILHDHKTKCII